MTKRILTPIDSHKSFYGKAYVLVDDSGNETLYSYGTPVMRREPNGKHVRLWDDYSATTMRHIISFCGFSISKRDWLKMKVEV